MIVPRLPEHVTIEPKADGAFTATCGRCGVSEYFRGYTVEGVTPGLARRHADCGSRKPAPAAPAVERAGLFDDVPVAASGRKQGRR